MEKSDTRLRADAGAGVYDGGAGLVKMHPQ